MDLVGVPAAEQWPVMLAAARKIEALGFASVWVYDHFHTVPRPTQEATHEAWTLMAALAAATTRVRLGQMCTCNSYRPPSYLAKVASTVDVISGGRLDVAIGAGWYEHEYRAYGYEYPSDGTRLAQLEEAVQIILKMWTEDEAHFAGEHYRVEGAINQPKGMQQPHPPLWIAGGGERKTLRIVARYADFANFGGTLDTFVHKSRVLAGHCEAIGRDPAEIGRTLHAFLTVGTDAADLADKVTRSASQTGRTPEAYLENSQMIAGTVDQVVERLAAFRDAGCVHLIGYYPDLRWGDTLDLVATEVIPALG